MFKEKDLLSKLASKTCFLLSTTAHVQDLFGKPTTKPKQTGMTKLNGEVHFKNMSNFIHGPLTLLHIVPVSVFS